MFFQLSSEVLVLHSISCVVQVGHTCCVQVQVRFAFVELRASAAAEFSEMS